MWKLDGIHKTGSA